MRYYDVQISDPATGSIVKRFTSIDQASGSTLPGALNIEIDVPIYTYDVPAGA